MTKQIKTYELFDVVGGMGGMGEHPEGKWILKKDHDEIAEKLVEENKIMKITINSLNNKEIIIKNTVDKIEISCFGGTRILNSGETLTIGLGKCEVTKI